MATGEYVTRGSCRGNNSTGSMDSSGAPGINTGKYYDQRITWSTTTNAATKTTSVTLNYYVRCNNTIAKTRATWYAKVAGSSKAGVNFWIDYPGYTNNWKFMGTTTYTVAHNPDTGAASTTLTASFYQNMIASEPYALRDGSISHTIALETISTTGAAKGKHANAWKKAVSVMVRRNGAWVAGKPQGKHNGAWKNAVD